LYLWHWPLFTVTRPGLDIPLGVPATLVLRLLVSFVLAELSYRYIEEPVRSGRLLRALRARIRAAGTTRVSRPQLAAAAICVVSVSFVTRAFVAAEPPTEPSYELAPPVHAEGATRSVTGVRSLPTDAPPADATPKGPQQAHLATPGEAPSVLVFGDSVVLGASRYLRAAHGGELQIDSEVGRTTSTALPRLRKLKRTHRLADVLIVHVGNNGWVYEEQIDEMMALFEGVSRVVFVNARVPRRWQDRNNQALAAALARYPRAVLVDWAKASEGHREWFGSDGLHLTHAGAEAFAHLLSPYFLAAP
jgi:hypothetical protein